MGNSQNSRQLTLHLFWQVTQIVGGPCPVLPQDIIFWCLLYLAVFAVRTLTWDLQTTSYGHSPTLHISTHSPATSVRSSRMWICSSYCIISRSLTLGTGKTVSWQRNQILKEDEKNRQPQQFTHLNTSKRKHPQKSATNILMAPWLSMHKTKQNKKP
jgi:hypothetical protein